MYVCIYIHIYTYIHIYIYIQVHLHTRTHIAIALLGTAAPVRGCESACVQREEYIYKYVCREGEGVRVYIFI